MRIEKLFNVLVLGGASLGLAACGETSGGSSGGGGEDGSGGAAANPEGTGGGDTSGGLGGSGRAGDTGSTSTTVSTGSMLMCSPVPDPNDPCGCPCCWVDNCSNEDADCCAGFCEGICC